jgi:hypothetical protein
MRIVSLDLPVYEFVPAENMKAARSFYLADPALPDSAASGAVARPLT